MTSRAVLGWLAAALVIAALIPTTQSASAAATRTWTGLGPNSNWSTSANWDTGVPVAGDSIVFPSVAARKTNNNNLAANTIFQRIDFTGSGYDIDGNSLQLNDFIWHDPGSGTNVFDIDIVTLGGIQQKSGRLIIGGNNSFDDEVDVDGGVLVVTTDTGLGTTADFTDIESPGTLQLTGGVDIGMERVDIEGHGFDLNGSLQSLNGTNRADDVRVRGPSTIGVASNSRLVIDTLRQLAPGMLTLVGGGKLQVENSVFVGPVDVVEGNLTWNASSQVFVEVGRFGWLRGLGTVSSATVVSGLIWPGSGNNPGVLTVFGATTFEAGTLRIDLDGPVLGSGYGQLATGSLSLAPGVSQLDLDLTYNPTIGTVFTIVNNSGGGPVQGTFRELAEGATFIHGGFAFRISYKGGDGNDVTLTVLRQVTADVKLTATVQPSPVGPGELLIYTATVTNHGPDSAPGPQVTMGTPVGTTFESVQAPAGWTCVTPSPPNVSVSCSGPTLASGQSATFTFAFRVKPGQAGSISGTISASSDANDPTSADTVVALSTPIGPGGGKPFKVRLPMLAADSAQGGPGG